MSTIRTLADMYIAEFAVRDCRQRYNAMRGAFAAVQKSRKSMLLKNAGHGCLRKLENSEMGALAIMQILAFLRSEPGNARSERLELEANVCRAVERVETLRWKNKFL